MSSANQVEGFDRFRSALARLKFAEPEQGEPVRVGLTGHELGGGGPDVRPDGCARSGGDWGLGQWNREVS
jgi:hypothetical protein